MDNLWSSYTIKNRQKLYKKKLKSPFDLKLKQYYIKYRNILNLLIKKARCLYYSDIILLSKKNMKTTWKLINEFSYIVILRKRTSNKLPE
jgi:hypothetical protein